MAELLKNMYSPAFYEKFCSEVKKVISDFDSQQFTHKIFEGNWEQKELKERMSHTAIVLHQFLPNTFTEAAPILKKISENLIGNINSKDGFAYMFFPDYIEKYGINDIKTSIPLMETVTQLASCEFAIRPFIVKYPTEMIHQMTEWSKHSNHHVRRLSSEGIRPRLPWGMALHVFKNNPAPILPILENLKTDSSEYVRKSVANNINDISKDNPEIVLNLIEKWKGTSKETDWIIKHGSRTLLKQGHPEIFKYYQLKTSDHLLLQNFKLENHVVKQGAELNFSFTIQNNDNITHELRLEYAMYYKRQSATPSKKVFKISEKILQPNDSLSVAKKQSFKPITTRKYYPGTHQIGIIINGVEKGNLSFELE